MNGKYFYENRLETVDLVISQLFNNIKVNTGTNDNKNIIVVPLVVSDGEKSIKQMLQEQNDKIEISVPIIGVLGNSIRPTNEKTSRYNSHSTRYGHIARGREYVRDYTISIMAAEKNEIYQMVEQIIPYFDPQVTATIIDDSESNNQYDMTVSLNSINKDGEDMVSVDEIQARIWELEFSVVFKIHKYYDKGQNDSDNLIRWIELRYSDNSMTKIEIIPENASPDDEYECTITNSVL